MPLRAGAGAAPQAPTLSPPASASAWLQRMQQAASQRNYQGVLVTSSAGRISSSRVAHCVEGGQTAERVEALDGHQKLVVRQDKVVHTLWPQRKLALVEERDAAQSLAQPGQGVEPRALASYDVQLGGSERVAGRQAQVLLMRPRDDLRYAQRIWADVQTGLMLRADTLGPRMETLESVSFSDVEVDARLTMPQVVQGLKQLDGYRVMRQPAQPAQLADEGWQFAGASLPGFKLTQCVRRSLELSTADDGAAATANVLQAAFTDGLTHVSLFIEPYQPARHRKALATQMGATHTLMQRLGNEHWLTAVGDVPLTTLQQFARALERAR